MNSKIIFSYLASGFVHTTFRIKARSKIVLSWSISADFEEISLNQHLRQFKRINSILAAAKNFLQFKGKNAGLFPIQINKGSLLHNAEIQDKSIMIYFLNKILTKFYEIFLNTGDEFEAMDTQ